jgi:Cu(I)/Ag(I) efflux system membrane protein CusA/SilA
VRSDPDAIASEVMVSLPNGAAVPLGEVASIARSQGPTLIRTEGGELVVYVYVDIRGRDLGGYVHDAQRTVTDNVAFPAGVHVKWSGQFEYLERAAQRLILIVPATLLVIFLLLYLNFRRLSDTLIVMLSLPFSLVGGLWLMYWMGFNMSVAAAVGFIALAGVAAETGVIMLIYLDHARRNNEARCVAEGRPFTNADARDAVMSGAVERVRPKLMTVTAIMVGLVPILWSTGAGSEVMRRIAMPMIGGMVSSTILTLVVIPAVYALVNRGLRPRPVI